jgi:hypothetical protein
MPYVTVQTLHRIYITKHVWANCNDKRTPRLPIHNKPCACTCAIHKNDKALFYYINPNKMHILQSLFYLTIALHVSDVLQSLFYLTIALHASDVLQSFFILQLLYMFRTFYRVFFIWQLLYMFRTLLSPILRSTKQLYLQHLVTVTPYCCLLLLWKCWNCSTIAADNNTV